MASFQEEIKSLHGVVALGLAWWGPSGETATLATKCMQTAKTMEGRMFACLAAGAAHRV